ncbi:MAG TPA: Flp pilus assembly protein CpaB [Dehalococcoidia bacterium]|nr:Flp pilus assembly protein CpaB [Dehalococcoidia bacterium]
MARTQELRALGNNRGLLALAVGSGLVAAILVFVALASGGGGGDSTPADTTFAAVVAQQDIGAGAKISADMVKVVQVPQAYLVSGAFSEVQPILGETARYPIASGEQVTRIRVGAQAREDILAFVVPKGMRALSVSVDETTGVGGLLHPGDRVDVVAVFTDSGANSDLTEVNTVLQNVEVLAVAQKAQAPVPPADTGSAGSAQSPLASEATSGQPPKDLDPQPDARTVTLAITPDQAQLLAYAQEKGKVFLSLRSFGDGDTPQLPALIVPELNP